MRNPNVNRHPYTIRYDCPQALGGAALMQSELISVGYGSWLRTPPAGEVPSVEFTAELREARGAGLMIVSCKEHAMEVHPLEDIPDRLVQGDEPLRVITRGMTPEQYDGGVWVQEAELEFLNDMTMERA
jgi:hypothetical protein